MNDEGRMTCQICGRPIKANRGNIAHHGYKRPQDWGGQTSSCYGALKIPYEEARDALGREIELVSNQIADTLVYKGYIENETWPAVVLVRGRDAYSRPKSVGVTRETFAEFKAEQPRTCWENDFYSFEHVKAWALKGKARKVKELEAYKSYLQHRFDNWKQTHVWDGHEHKPLVAA